MKLIMNKIFVFLMVFMSFVVSGYALDADSTLQGYWKFNSDLTDSSDNSTTLLNTGGSFATGVAGQGRNHLSSEDYMSVSNPNFFNFNNNDNFTLSLYFELDNAESGFYHLISKGPNGGPGQNQYAIKMDTGIIQFNTNSGTNGNIQYNAPFLDNTFYHVVAVKNGTTARLYLDGVEVVNTTSFPTDIASTGTEVRLGARQSDNGAGFVGTIDEVSIWSRALSAQEVSDLYNTTQINFPGGDITVNVNVPVNGFNYTFDVENLTFDVDTSGPASCEYQYNSSNTSMSTGDNTNHTALFEMGNAGNFSETFNVTFFCLDTTTNNTISENVVFYRQGVPLALDIIVPADEQIFVAETEQIQFYLQTNYVAVCSHQTNNDSTVQFTNTNSSIHTTLFNVANDTFTYTSNFSCAGVMINQTVSGVVTYFIAEGVLEAVGINVTGLNNFTQETFSVIGVLVSGITDLFTDNLITLIVVSSFIAFITGVISLLFIYIRRTISVRNI